MHMPAPSSSSAACDSMFSTKLNHPVGFRSVISLCCVCVCVCQDWSVDLNRTLSRREKKKPSEGVTLTGISQTGSDQPVQPAKSTSRYLEMFADKHLKPNICSHKLYFIPSPQNRDNPACEGTLVNCYIIEVLGVTCSCTAVSMAKVNISSQFVGKVFIPVKPESAGTKLTASQIK